MKNYYFRIADINIHVRVPFEIKIIKESEKFIIKSQEVNIEISFIEIKEALQIKDDIVYNSSTKIYKVANGFIHEFYLEPSMKPCAWLIQVDEYNYELRYLKGKEYCLEYSRNILEAINIEQILNKFNAFILHSSFIRWQVKAILFTAPSGTGKSTQADLWKKNENAEVINGDRSGIRKMDGKWTAYGLPIAGSSEIYKNKKAEISHIIILKQGKENKLIRLSSREAFIKLYSETLVHTWDKEFQENIINMITDVVQNVRIYQYECLPDKSAVEFLKKQVIKDNKIGNNNYN